MTIRTDNMTVLQTAVFSRLSLALTPTVYSSPPLNEPYPYVVIGDDEVGEELEASGKLLEHTLTVDVISALEGTEECKTLAGIIQNDLTTSVIDLTGDNFSALRAKHAATNLSQTTDHDNVRINRASVVFEVKVQDTI